jgi:3-oxoacyl-[acyl-carrier-protein] synthase-1
MLYKSAGFDSMGVSLPVNVVEAHENNSIHTSLKIASGFGGCNAAVLFSKSI